MFIQGNFQFDRKWTIASLLLSKNFAAKCELVFVRKTDISRKGFILKPTERA